MKNLTKILCAFLCVTMLFSISSVNIFAQGDESEKELYLDETNEPNCSACFDYEDDTITSDVFWNEKLNADSNRIELSINNIESIYSSADEIKENILSTDVFTVDGVVSVNDKIVEISDYYDFTKENKYNITKWAYEIGKITKEEEIECLCDLVIMKNFDNIDCLEGVIDYIKNYAETGEIDEVLIKKISSVIGSDNDVQADHLANTSISNEATYSNSYFTIHYDSSVNTLAEARAVAAYFSTVRSQYMNMGFNTPILETGEIRFHVYLDPGSGGGSAAVTYKVNVSGNKCASYIILFNFRSLTDAVRQRIAHEYFHAIQNAYNHDSGWFKESMANWGKIIITGQSSTCDLQVRDFIGSSDSLDSSTSMGYGAVVLPLAIHYKFGGSDTILEIYKEYETYSSTDLSTNQIRTVVTDAIVARGYSGSFNLAYRAMSAYVYRPYVWYNGICSGSSNWSNNTIVVKTTYAAGATMAFSGSTASLTSDYYTIKLPTNVSAASVKVEVSFSNSNGYLQKYTINSSGTHTVSYTGKTNNASTFIEHGLGVSLNDLALIISNLDESASLTYTVKITIMPTNEDINIVYAKDVRYLERPVYLGAGECAEFTVTFPSSGSKLFQTFGTKDTKIELYSSSGNLLESDDDDGYRLNALLRYYVTKDVEYTIRVYFYSSSNAGDTKLTITPAFGALNSDVDVLETYENIYSVTSYTGFTWLTFAQPNYTRVITFTPPSSGSYTFTIESEFDTYIYVIDPRSSELVKFNVNYNDDGGEGMNPLLTTALEANVPYLIIYSAYNPNSLTETQSLTVQISKN